MRLRTSQLCKVLEVHLRGENSDCEDSGAGAGKGLCLEFGGTGLGKWRQIQQGFVGSAEQFGLQFQSKESLCKVHEQESDMM